MPLSVQLLNKQRRFKVDPKEIEAMTQKLCSGVLEDLTADPVAWLKPSHLKAFSKRGTLSLILVSSKKIRELNREWRQKDYATDVLSFPLAVGDDHSVDIMPGDEEIELGELIISLEKAAEQAADYNHSFERELAFLFVHGVLHVLGFDHITKAQEKDMFGRQTRILAQAGFPR